MSATIPQPLLELLRDATARGRPALTLTFARVAELLGEMPADGWWLEHRDAVRTCGFDAGVDHDRQWVTFEHASAIEPGPEEAAPATVVDVRVTFRWTGEGATDPTAWVDGSPVPFDLSSASARNLAEAVRRSSH